MNGAPLCDENLLRRLPLPLAQLYRRAHNAKSPLERHQAAFYLWEASLKLLGTVAVVEYAELSDHDPQLAERLRNLARPSLGHWWEFVRRLIPILSTADEPFMAVRDLVLGKARDDLPRAAGLDAVLGQALDGRGNARGTVRLSELFDRLVHYRNREVGHGAAGQRSGDFYERMGRALLAGVGELLGRLDVLAGRRLLYLEDLRKQANGHWLVERAELIGEGPRRIESLELPADAEAARRLCPQQVYLEVPVSASGPALRALHPLLIHDAESGEMLFLNARRNKQRLEYLGYSSGRTIERPEWLGEQRALLARVLNMPVAEGQAELWAARSQAEEQVEEQTEAVPALRRLGEFELLSELGRGGMGVVYRAWQPSLGRQVALKALFRTGDPKAEARFAREIHALGRVEHPHLVKIFTSGSDGDQWFYAMELVEGATLGAVCERLASRGADAAVLDLPTWRGTLSTVCEEARQAEKPLSGVGHEGMSSWRTAAGTAAPTPAVTVGGRGYVRHMVELVRQAALATHALHACGVIHRDIKPGNVMVTEQGGQAVLMDLGLAQLADDVQGKLTRTRQFVGTLRYASPEQVDAVGRLDRRSDVYSLGATLWELLTLRPLFGATEETPTPEVIHRIQRTDPEPVRRYNAAASADLEAVVQKCLEKDAGQRYASAAELVVELERVAAGEPVRARPVGRLERGWRWCKRNPVVAGLVAAVALSLVAGTAGAAYFAVQATARAADEASAKLTAEEARDEARQAGAQARDLARKEGEAKREALLRKEKAEWLAYTGQLALAQREWQDGNAGHARELLDGCQWDLRGWEHDYLHTLFHASQRTLGGHTNPVNSVCFSPDGTRLASASVDQTVRVRDTRPGQEALVFRGHTGPVYGVAFSPDGTRLASSSWDQTVKVWEASTGQEPLTLRGHAGIVWSVCFSPDGTKLASASEDQTVKVWNAQTGRELLTLRGHTGPVYAVAFSPDGTRLASASEDMTVKVWNAQAGREELTLRRHAGIVWSVCFSPDGTRLASASEDRTIKLWDTRSGKETVTLKGHGGAVYSVAFSPDGTRLASASEDRTVKVWDSAWPALAASTVGLLGAPLSQGPPLAVAGLFPGRMWDTRSGQETLTFRGHTDAVTGVCFSPDGTRLASASWDKTVKVWDARSDQETRTLTGHSSSVKSVCFGPDGARLASASWDKTIKVWDIRTGLVLRTLRGHGHSVDSVCFSPDGTRLASASWDKTVKVWDADRVQEPLTLTGHTDAVGSVCFSPDGTRLASASWDKTVKVWDARTGQEALTLTGHVDAVSGVCFSPDGLRLASASEDQTARVWDARSGQEVLVLQGHTSSVRGVCFSPDGTRLATAADDQTIKIWDARDGRELLTLRGHTGSVRGVRFSPDGTRLASASVDQTVKLWDARSGQEQETLTLKGHGSGVLSVAFSPDGTRLASASWDRTVKIWDGHAGQETLLLKGAGGPVRSVGFSADGKHIVGLARRGDVDEVSSWDAQSGALLPTGAEAPPPANAGPMARSSDGRLLVCTQGNTLIVRRLEGPRSNRVQPRDEEGGPGNPQAVVLKLEGKYACSGTNPDGGRYGGVTVEIRRRGGDYYFTWIGNGVNAEGEGTVVGNELVVTFKGTTGRGTVVYKILTDGTLAGTWKPKGSKTEGEEMLKRK